MVSDREDLRAMAKVGFSEVSQRGSRLKLRSCLWFVCVVLRQLHGPAAQARPRADDGPSRMTQSRLEVRRWDHRGILLVPLEKAGITADEVVDVVSARQVDNVDQSWKCLPEYSRKCAFVVGIC